MTQIRIENPVEIEFAMVPNAVWQTSLSFKAKGLFCYLLTYRHGGSPTVKQIEAETGLSRDARRKAMKELTEYGLAEYQYIRKNGQIVGSELVVSTVSLYRETENQASGESHRAPENPAVGVSAPTGTENRPYRDGFSGDLLRERKIKSVAKARAAIKPKPKDNPWRSADEDVLAAATAFADPSATGQERGQIVKWLAKRGFGSPADFERTA